MSIHDELAIELKAAMRDRDKPRINVIRQIETEVSVAKSAPGFSGEADDDLYLKTIESYVKKMDKARARIRGGRRARAGERRQARLRDRLSRPLVAREARRGPDQSSRQGGNRGTRRRRSQDDRACHRSGDAFGRGRRRRLGQPAGTRGARGIAGSLPAYGRCWRHAGPSRLSTRLDLRAEVGRRARPARLGRSDGGAAQPGRQRHLGEVSRAERLSSRSPLVLDGEIVALDDRGRPSFERLQQRMNLSGAREIAAAAIAVPISYVAFDVLFDGGDVTDEPGRRRRAGWTPSICRRRSYLHGGRSDPTALWALVEERGFEGIMAKRRGSTYRPGRGRPTGSRSPASARSGPWSADTYPATGPVRHFGSLLLGLWDAGSLRWIGAVGSGFGEPRCVPSEKRSTSSRWPTRRLAPTPTSPATRCGSSPGWWRWCSTRSSPAPGACAARRSRGFTDDDPTLITWEREGPGVRAESRNLGINLVPDLPMTGKWSSCSPSSSQSRCCASLPAPVLPSRWAPAESDRSAQDACLVASMLARSASIRSTTPVGWGASGATIS